MNIIVTRDQATEAFKVRQYDKLCALIEASLKRSNLTNQGDLDVRVVFEVQTDGLYIVADIEELRDYIGLGADVIVRIDCFESAAGIES